MKKKILKRKVTKRKIKKTKITKKSTKRKSNPSIKSLEKRILEAEERLRKAKEEVDRDREAGISLGSSLGMINYGEYLSAKNRLDDLMYEEMTDKYEKSKL